MITTYQTTIKKHPSWKVPKFDTINFKKKTKKYLLCVFVINEGEKIKKQIREMKQYSRQLDIIIADGGSKDGSLKEGFLRDNSIRALLTKTGPGKLSAQMRMAFAWTLDEGYEGVIVVDGNGKDDLSAIPLFVEKLNEGYDHVQGSRFIPGGHAINTPIERHLAVKILHSPMISLAAKERHTDTTNGFRAYSSRLLMDPDINIFRDVFDSYELHYYLAIEASRNKQFKTSEVPVTRTYPAKGKTPTKISPIKGNLKVLTILIRATLGHYRDNSHKRESNG